MNQDQGKQVDPFLKRFGTVKANDVVIFRFPKDTSPENLERARAQLVEKMGTIRFVVIREDVDVTVLQQPEAAGVLLA